MKTNAFEKQLKELNFELYKSDEVFNTMPKDIQDISKVELFNLGKYITNSELEKEFESRGLVPATPTTTPIPTSCMKCKLTALSLKPSLVR